MRAGSTVETVPSRLFLFYWPVMISTRNRACPLIIRSEASARMSSGCFFDFLGGEREIVVTGKRQPDCLVEGQGRSLRAGAGTTPTALSSAAIAK
ncbi:MAG TPA: hypothetical protein VGH34_07550 [Vicinamibacterales bacterium]|jgi:hypothetical protein